MLICRHKQVKHYKQCGERVAAEWWTLL